MRKTMVSFSFFFLTVCVFGQSQDAEIENLKRAVIPYSGKTLEDAFGIFTSFNSSINYQMSFTQPDPPNDQFYKDIDITVKNEFGRADYFYRIELSSMEAFLNMVIINWRTFNFDIFGLPDDIITFTEYSEWIYDTFGDVRLWF